MIKAKTVAPLPFQHPPGQKAYLIEWASKDALLLLENWQYLKVPGKKQNLSIFTKLFVVEKHSIPSSLVVNLDQIPSKYVEVSRHTMAKKGVSTVEIVSSGDKHSITATFAISLDGTFLPMQLVYDSKTQRSIPKVEFPSSFSLSANPKHYSNTAESIKIINEI